MAIAPLARVFRFVCAEAVNAGLRARPLVGQSDAFECDGDHKKAHFF